jgi:hypothetical protein
MLASLILGCSGSAPPAAKQQNTTAVPRITPPPPRTEPRDEPQPAKTPEPPSRHPVGPWLEYQVANSDLIDSKGYIRLLTPPGFDSVLELTSYDSPEHEEFPSLYIRAVTKGDNLADLVQKKLTGDLYIMTEKDGNVIHTLPTQPIELIISEIDGKNIRGTFAGRVHDVDLGGDGPITGKFQAIVE